MSFPRDVLLNLDAQAAQLLAKYGYVRINSDTDGPFGSYVSEYRSSTAFISLVWDGKEGWLSLLGSKRSFFAVSSPTTELFFERFPGFAVSRPIYQAAASKLLDTLAEHLASGL